VLHRRIGIQRQRLMISGQDAEYTDSIRMCCHVNAVASVSNSI